MRFIRHLVNIGLLATNIRSFSMTTSASMSALETLRIVDIIQEKVFGKIDDPQFPLPMSSKEAGPGPGGQRRYLWTDSFGILNYCSQAMLLGRTIAEGKKENSRRLYLNAAKKLIDAVFTCLGAPRSSKYPMAVDDSGNYKGLRIGKVKAREGSSDAGMTYDGMYWHYIDKVRTGMNSHNFLKVYCPPMMRTSSLFLQFVDMSY